MDYTQAAETLLDKNVLLGVVVFLIAAMVMLILVAKAVEAGKKLFAKPKSKEKTDILQEHCAEAEERFRRGEKHIAENHDHIADLREGQRVMCVAVMALLGHELHNGNSEEMNNALVGLNKYLINRK